MKKIILYLFLVLCSSLLAQQSQQLDDGVLDTVPIVPAWIMGTHILDAKDTYEGIGKIISAGYNPTAIEVEGKTLSVLYQFYGADNPARKWILYQFDRLDKFEVEFTGFLKKSWIPVDFAKTDKGVYVFFIKDTETKVDGWRVNIARLPAEVEDIKDALERNNFHITGITQSEVDEYWLLSINTGTVFPTILRNFTAEELDAGVAEALQKGLDVDSMMHVADNWFLQFTEYQ